MTSVPQGGSHVSHIALGGTGVARPAATRAVGPCAALSTPAALHVAVGDYVVAIDGRVGPPARLTIP